jgi:hypothetical protein
MDFGPIRIWLSEYLIVVSGQKRWMILAGREALETSGAVLNRLTLPQLCQNYLSLCIVIAK